MNQRWWNNEISCIVLGINQRYFSSKKDSVEMFSAYMQVVTFKKITIFYLFYLQFCFGPQICIGNSSFRICGVVTWHSSVRNIILLHTRARARMHSLSLSLSLSHFTKNFSHPTTCSSHATFWLGHSYEPRQTNRCWELFQSTDLCHHFQFVFDKGDPRISMWYFLPCQGKSN